MRVISRIALSLLAAMVLVQPTFAQPQQQANCPLTLTATNPPASSIALSPHGAFRSGNQVFVLRGQTLTTYAITDLGDLSIAREDFVSGLAGRNSIGGVAFSNGYLYVSSEAGLEIYDLRNVRSGGTAPAFVTRVGNLNYRRLAVNGNILAALFPATDVPCAPTSLTCPTFIDIFNVANPASPVRVSTVSSNQSAIGSFNDIAFNFGTLVVAGTLGTAALNLSNPAIPSSMGSVFTPGTFLVSNGTNLVGVGSDNAIVTYAIGSPFNGFAAITYHSTATLQVGRANRIVFHPQAFIDDANNRLITIIDEIDPSRLTPARSIAFDVFEYSVPMFEGRDPRVYESVSYLQGDEVKYNPIAVGPVVFVVGEMTGLQTYGACGQMAGRIETDNVAAMPCGGSEIHGWVTGAQRIERVEIFLDNNVSRTSTSLGLATVGGVPRTDIPSTTPVVTWRLSTLLDTTARGNYTLRAVGTDALNNRRQFASQPIFFPGPGQNCFNRRRTTGK